MAPSRRIGASDSKTRAMLVDAAEQLMLDEGYAAVTSRRVGAKAGLKPQLVHYYFRTMDELFLEVFRRRAEKGLDRFQRAVEKDRSLGALWKLSSDPTEAAFSIEFVALANHRKAIRAEVANYAERFRKLQLDAIAATLEDHGVSPEVCPPLVALVAMTGIAQVLGLEDVLGVTAGHEETLAFVDQYIGRIEGTQKKGKTTKGTTRRKTSTRPTRRP